jgi:NAD(P)-dependent dehydrogenase (short-subunit alcohol dehydrogenase family)
MLFWPVFAGGDRPQVQSFGKNTPLGRAGQPAEQAPAYVLLASDEAGYMTGALIPVTGALIPVTGGQPTL